MRSFSWKRIVEQMRADDSASRVPDSETFWTDFKARARMHPQETVERAPVPRAIGLAVVAACGLVMVAGVFLHQRPAGGGEDGVIKSVEVVASHAAVVIMKDEPTHSTILWVVDMDVDGEN